MKIAIINDQFDTNKVLAISPAIARKYHEMGHELFLQPSFWSSDFDGVCAKLSSLENIDLILSSAPLSANTVQSISPHTMVIGALDPYWNQQQIQFLLSRNILTFSLELLPRTTKAQPMDINSSQANLTGYQAVMEAIQKLGRVMPLFITSAGTLPAAHVLVLGAGVAGLQAIATARRLGAKTSAFDIRTAAKEQVESLGAKFVEVQSDHGQNSVYATEASDEYKKAQRLALQNILPDQDIIITTAQIPGKKAPVLIDKNLAQYLKPGAVVVDLAQHHGGNCEIPETAPVIQIKFDNILNPIANDASQLLARNFFNFVQHLTSADLENPDDILRQTCINKVWNKQ